MLNVRGLGLLYQTLQYFLFSFFKKSLSDGTLTSVWGESSANGIVVQTNYFTLKVVELHQVSINLRNYNY